MMTKNHSGVDTGGEYDTIENEWIHQFNNKMIRTYFFEVK